MVGGAGDHFRARNGFSCAISSGAPCTVLARTCGSSNDCLNAVVTGTVCIEQTLHDTEEIHMSWDREGGGGAIKEVHRMSENTWREAAQWGGCLPFPPVLQPGVAGPRVLPQLHRLPVKEVKSRWVISTSSQQFSICS